MLKAKESNSDFWSLVSQKITQGVAFWLERMDVSCFLSEEVKGQSIHQYFQQCPDVLVVSNLGHYSKLSLLCSLGFGSSNAAFEAQKLGAKVSQFPVLMPSAVLSQDPLPSFPYKSLFPIRCLKLYFLQLLRNNYPKYILLYLNVYALQGLTKPHILYSSWSLALSNLANLCYLSFWRLC